MKKDKMGAEQCYLALVLIEEAISKGAVFRKNKELKRWLAGKFLLVNDENKIGIKAAKRIFWLLSSVNGFIGRGDKEIVVTEYGCKFFRGDEFKRAEIFKNSKIFPEVSIKSSRHCKGAVTEIVRKGYRLVRYKGVNKNREYTKAGWINEFAHFEFGDKIDSVSVAFYHAEQEGDSHEHSRTEEAFIFISGHGYMEVGEERKRVPMNSDWAIIIESGVSHRVIPVANGKNGKYLTAFVLSFPGWKSKNEYKIGESSQGRYDGPVE